MSKKALVLALCLAPLGLTACPEKEEEVDSGITDDSATPAMVEECTTANIYESMLKTYSATYVVDSTVDDHHKVHFDMPAGVAHVIATTTWDCTDWSMNVDVGEGVCPHSGTTYVEDTTDGGALVVDVYPQDVDEALETFVEGDVWFVHMGTEMATPPADGSTCEITIKAETCELVPAR